MVFRTLPVLVLALGAGLFAACEPEAPPADPARGEEIPLEASPYQGTLVFQSDRAGHWDIYRMEADGSELVRLTDHPAADQHPSWSPDGSLIVFSSERTGAGDIYVMDADGGNLRRLTEDPAYEGSPRFSPDGRFVVFDGERSGRSEIYRVGIDGGEVERITDSLTRKLGPAFAPDGSELAYMETGLLWWQVSVMDWRSRRPRTVTGGGGSCRPEWSPDGTLLAYVSTKDTPKADVWLREMGGEREGRAWQVPTRPNAHNYDPAFSLDGMALAIASTIVRGENEQWDLFVMDLNGRNRVRLTGEEGNERFPDWRPAAPGVSGE